MATVYVWAAGFGPYFSDDTMPHSGVQTDKVPVEADDVINKAYLDDLIPEGSNTGDILRWDAVSGSWEVAVEPFDLKQVNFTPLTAALEDVEGGVYYNSNDKAMYVCVEGA